MKKILSIILVALLFVGCSNKTDDEYKTKAIQAFVNNTNKLVGKEAVGFEMTGKMDIPTSLVNKTEIKATMDMQGSFDVKKKLGEIKVNFEDDKSAQKQAMKLYFDENYVYVNYEDQWLKQPIEASAKESLSDEKFDTNKKSTVEDVTKTFDELKDTKYSKVTQNNVEGYLIEATISLDKISDILKETSGEQTAKDQLEQMKAVINKLDITYAAFIPLDESKDMNHTLSMNMEVLKSKVNIGPVDFKLKEAKADISIPKAAKKAKAQASTSMFS